MTHRRPGPARVKTLWEMSCTAVKDKVPVSLELVCGLPLPLIEELAVLLPWADLLKLEEALNNKEVTEKAWQRHYEELPRYKHDQKKQQACSHGRDEPDILLSFRDRWLSVSMSSSLLQSFFRWNLYPTESSTVLSPFVTEDVGFLVRHPRLSFSDFHRLFMMMAQQVKKMSMRLNTLRQLSGHPRLLTALSTSLTALRVDFLSLVRSEAWLQVLKEMTLNGRLKSLHLINLGSAFVDWLLLLFMVSGLFHCRLCAQHFSASMEPALHTSERTHSPSFLCGPKAAPDAMDTGEEYAKLSDESLAPIWNSVEWNVTGSSQRQDSSVSTRSHHTQVSKLRQELSQCLSSGLCSDFVSGLKDFGYAGLAKKEETQKMGSGAQDTSAAEGGLTRESDKRVGDGGEGGTGGEGGVSCAEKSHGTTAFPTSSECFDLLDEALGVRSDRRTSRSRRGARRSAFLDFNQPVGVKEANIRLMEKLSHIHAEEGHASTGIEHLSASWKSSNLSFPKDDTSVSMFEALGCHAPGWPSLSSISVDIGMLGDLMDKNGLDNQYFFDALLCGIRAGNLQSVALYSSLDILEWKRLCRFFWETLKALSGSDRSISDARRTQPMRLLKIDSFPVQMINVDLEEGGSEPWSAGQEDADTNRQPASAECAETGVGPDRSTFPGLQELYLKFVSFLEGAGAFLPLERFIRGDHALRHISLHECYLDEGNVDLLLKALNSGGHSSLTCIELNGSLSSVSESQWQQLCQILHRSPALACLSLVHCRLKPDHINHPEFVEAVRSHSTERKLKLDLSSNRHVGDSIWDFMVKTVRPDSSLKELHFRETCSGTERGVEAIEEIIKEHSAHLPLLHACSWTGRGSDPHAHMVKDCLQRIAATMTIPSNMEEEFLAMM